jgi:hypothetical protein
VDGNGSESFQWWAFSLLLLLFAEWSESTWYGDHQYRPGMVMKKTTAMMMIMMMMIRMMSVEKLVE